MSHAAELPVALLPSLPLPLFFTLNALTHKHIPSPNYSSSLCSFSLSVSPSLFPSFISLKFEIRVESKVSVFIMFSSEIHYFLKNRILEPRRMSLVGEGLMFFFGWCYLTNFKRKKNLLTVAGDALFSNGKYFHSRDWVRIIKV